MQATSHPEINHVLDILLAQIQAILGKKLVGVYLYGSLVTGDFDTEISDIDVLAALSSEIDEKEFRESVKDHTKSWGEWMNDMHTRPAQAYAILTLCRALYSYTYGEQVSKRKAAEWAQTALSEWSSLIQNALIWRDDKREEQVD